MGKHAGRGFNSLGLPVIAAVARLLCWGRHCDWAHSTGYGHSVVPTPSLRPHTRGDHFGLDEA
jgi:hypothetical protein